MYLSSLPGTLRDQRVMASNVVDGAALNFKKNHASHISPAMPAPIEPAAAGTLVSNRHPVVADHGRAMGYVVADHGSAMGYVVAGPYRR